jgi:hypothetical protein
MMQRKFGTNWELCRQPDDLKKDKKLYVVMPTFESMMYYFPLLQDTSNPL